MTSDEILTVSEVAIELRCSKAHAYNSIAGKVEVVGYAAVAAFRDEFKGVNVPESCMPFCAQPKGGFVR
jgi:hypothetical protein